MKYALTYREVIAILMQRHVMVDGKVRTDKTYPAGFMGMSNHPFLMQLKIILSNFFKSIMFLLFSNPFHLLDCIADVVSIPKTSENFRLLYDTKGRFRLHSIKDEEAKVIFSSLISYRLCCMKFSYFILFFGDNCASLQVSCLVCNSY